MHLSPGIKLRARGLTWNVLSVEPCGTETRLRLRCADGDLAGLEWDLLHPWEDVAPIRADLRPEAPATVADWWLYHMARLLDREPGVGTLLGTHLGRVAVEPYQLVPVLRALDMPRPRLLLADGVGLGKTVQAGLIAAELIARRRAHRILVVTPPGPLLAQWARELRVRFGLRPAILADATALRLARCDLELGGNPFDATGLCLTSLDFAKQESVLAELERSAWDLVIIDEAHHCAGYDPVITQRRRLAEVLARRGDGLLLLTATPHDGNDAHFASLMALLDPGLVDGQGRLLGQAYRRHVVRRLKAHVRDHARGRPMFRERIVTPVAITLAPDTDAPVLAFHQALSDLITPRLRRTARSGEATDRHPTDMLAFIGLLKRSVSTLGACVNTLAVVADRHAALAGTDEPAMRRERSRTLRAYRRRLAQYGVLSVTEEAAQAELEAECMAAELRDDATGTDAALRTLIRLGREASAADPKLRALAASIHAIRATAPDANILVYTEYADSLDAAVTHLRADSTIDGTVLGIGGTDPEETRAAATDRFATEPRLILVSTDSLAEGLNLHHRCRHLIHLDLPYNPSRLEQRNGRIDRYGQRHEPEIGYLYLAGTFEERLLLRLIAKYERARAELSVMPDTLGVTADEAALAPGLVAGFAEDQAPLFPPAPSAIRTLDRLGEETGADTYRALRREIDRAYAAFEHMAARHGWLTGLGGTSATDIPSTVRRAINGVTPARFLTAAIAASPSPAPLRQSPTTTDPIDVLLVPPRDWHVDLTGLPGHDPTRGGLRITADPDRLRDEAGAELACPGWAHPLVRRAIDRVGIDPGHGPDRRVAVAVAPTEEQPAVLLTYALEQRDPRRIVLREVIAVHVPQVGAPAVLADASSWLALADRSAPPLATPWSTHFAHWVPPRLPEAIALATLTGTHLAEQASRRRQAMLAREAVTLERWLTRRAEELCGPVASMTPDLFGFVPAMPDWVRPLNARDRLAAYAAGAANPRDRRQDANAAMAVFDDRARDLQTRSDLGEPNITPIGLLMLVPAGS